MHLGRIPGRPPHRRGVFPARHRTSVARSLATVRGFGAPVDMPLQ